jgi:FixJ family two-component response regulator
MICVVEDDEAVRNSTGMLLEALGYRFVGFESAEAFLAAEKVEADCLILDHRLHALSGMELLELLRARGVKSPAIIVSDAPNHLAHRAARAGVVAMLRKPLSADALAQWLEEIFKDS